MRKASASAYDDPKVSDDGELRFGAPSGLIAMWTLYLLTFRQHLHGRRWLVMAIVFSLPAALVVLIRATASDVPLVGLEFMIAYLLIPQAMLPIVALVYAAGIIQDEQEDQTLTYLLIRPIPRWAIYTLKLLASLTTTVLLTTVFTALTFVAIYAGSSESLAGVSDRCLKTIAVHDLAVVTYCCLFGLISLLTNRTLVVGIIYIVIIEGLIANLPFGIRLITVIYYCRLIAYQSLSFKVTEHNHTEDIGADAWNFDKETMPEMISIQNCVTILLISCLVFTVIGSLLCARREFHVKTPELGN